MTSPRVKHSRTLSSDKDRKGREKPLLLHFLYVFALRHFRQIPAVNHRCFGIVFSRMLFMLCSVMTALERCPHKRQINKVFQIQTSQGEK